MWDRGRTPGQQPELPVAERRGDASGPNTPVGEERLMERVGARGNPLAALRRVKRNGGSSGVDGMTVVELPGYLRERWPRDAPPWSPGRSRLQPVTWVEIPKPGGGGRKLRSPPGLDRCLQQALRQVLQPMWDPTFSAGSDGFRLGRSAHQAVAPAQRYWGEGYGWVVDLDLETCFDQVNHDQLMHLGKERVVERRMLKRIDRTLKAGELTAEGMEAIVEDTPQGGPRIWVLMIQ